MSPAVEVAVEGAFLVVLLLHGDDDWKLAAAADCGLFEYTIMQKKVHIRSSAALTIATAASFVVAMPYVWRAICMP